MGMGAERGWKPSVSEPLEIDACLEMSVQIGFAFRESLLDGEWCLMLLTA